jgi:pyruvate formate lyase activating enzyme
MLDYPEHLATIFWFAGCSMRCLYCYNRDIVFGDGKISIDEALEFLDRREGLLEGVVLSGGDALLYGDLVGFAKEIKKRGFKIKLDTNGIDFKKVYELVEGGVVDYIALDYKAPKEKYYAITKDKHFHIFSETLEYLIKKDFPFEVRTTIHSDLIRVEEVNRIIKDLVKRGYKGTYYLQPFVYVDDTIGKVGREKSVFDNSKLLDDIEVVWR